MSDLARLLGRPQAVVDGSVLDVPPVKSGALWAFLVHQAGWIDRARLTLLLWPDAEQHRANANLRQLLRTLAGAPWGRRLERDRHRVRLLLANDAAEFASAAALARPVEAVAAYGGRFLDPFHVDDAPEFMAWAETERGTLHDRWRSLALAAIDASIASQAVDAAFELARRLLREDPCDEPAAQGAMRASLAIGDTTRALRAYRALASALRDELGAEPSPATQDLASRIVEGPVEAAPTAILAADPEPAPMERIARRIIGREHELQELTSLLWRPEVRLVSIVAPGGMGKTWLAQALAARLGTSYDDGFAFAHLDDVVGPVGLLHAIAQALGLRLGPDADARRQLLAFLAERNLLLVLDGFERHVAEHALVSSLVGHCPRLSLLVTSRRRLQHSDEHVFELGGLALSAHAGGEGRSEAARVFVRAAGRVAGVGHAEQLDPEQVDAVAAAVGGAPLALELCATWIGVAPLERILERLTSSWEPLRGDDVDRPVRHRDLRDLLSETWASVDAADRRAWSRLSVLRGSFDLDTAMHVGGCGWTTIGRLKRSSLLRTRGDRLEMHALVARLGREEAERSGDAASSLRALGELYAARFAAAAAGRGAPHELRADDLSNLAAAWRHAIHDHAFERLANLAVGLQRAFHAAGRPGDGATLCDEAVAVLEGQAGPWRDVALARLIMASSGHPADMRERVARASALADATNDDAARALVHAWHSWTLPVPEGRAHFERGARLCERMGDDSGVIQACRAFASRLTINGFYEEALPLLEEARRRALAVGSLLSLAHIDDARAINAFFRGDIEDAEALVLACRAQFEALGARRQAASSLQTLAWMARARRDLPRAAELCEVFVETQVEMGLGDGLDALIVQLLTSWSLGRYDDAWRHGHALLERFGSSTQASLVTDFTSVWLARVALRRGDPVTSRGLLRTAMRPGLERERPRLALDAAVVAAEYAATTGASPAAGDLLRAAWGHPAMDPESRVEASELAARLRLDLDDGRPRVTEDAANAAAEIMFRIRGVIGDAG
jgi:DNA-binding SARP family transcriptional activator